MGPHEEALTQPFGCHSHTCLILQKMTQLLWVKATQDSAFPRCPGGNMAAPGRQPVHKPTAKACCCPCPRSLRSCCPSLSLQHVQQPPASFSSSGGVGGLWIVCELEEEANKHLTLGNLGKGALGPICPASNNSSLPLRRRRWEREKSWVCMQKAPSPILSPIGLGSAEPRHHPSAGAARAEGAAPLAPRTIKHLKSHRDTPHH